MAKKTRRKKLEGELDELCANYVKIRDNYNCQKCGKRVQGRNCHWSHVVPRADRRLRWDVNNSKVLCFHDHQWWHSNVLESSDWFQVEFPDRFDHIHSERVKGPKKWSIMELEDLRDWFIREIENEK